MSSEKVKERRNSERRLSNAEFFKACEEVRNQRERLTTDKPTYPETAKFLSERLGFEISPASIKGIQETVGITWTSAKANTSGNPKGKSIVGNASRVLTYALERLFMEVDNLSKSLGQPGVEIPPTLERLVNFYANHGKNSVREPIENIVEDLEKTKTQGNTVEIKSSPEIPLKLPGTEVFKEGDFVYVDGNHSRRRKITKVHSQGRMAIVEGNWELETSRLKLANNRM